MGDVAAAGISVSRSEVITRVGTSIAARSGVESGRSAMPSAAAAIDAAGWAAISSRTRRRRSSLALLRQERRRALDQEVAPLRHEPSRQRPAPGRAFLAVCPGSGVRQDQAGEPFARTPPQLERHVSAHREPADDRAVHARRVQRLDASRGAGTHRHHVAGRRRTAEPREMWRHHGETTERRELRLPHPSVERERVDEQHAVGHRIAFALGPTTTGSAFGSTVNTAGSEPTFSPSANTDTRRFASTFRSVPRSIITLGCVACFPT